MVHVDNLFYCKHLSKGMHLIHVCSSIMKSIMPFEAAPVILVVFDQLYSVEQQRQISGVIVSPYGKAFLSKASIISK